MNEEREMLMDIITFLARMLDENKRYMDWGHQHCHEVIDEYFRKVKQARYSNFKEEATNAIKKGKVTENNPIKHKNRNQRRKAPKASSSNRSKQSRQIQKKD